MTKDILNFNVKIKGICPLLMARFPEEDWQDGQPKKPPRPLPKEEMYEKAKYKMEDGTLYCPASHIIGAMLKASSRVILKGKITYMEVVKGGIFIFPEEIPHLIQKVEIDYRHGSNGTGAKKIAIMVARARLENWELSFKLSCFDNRAGEAEIRQILEIAGAYIGVGSYRPRYGRFEIVGWEKV